MASSNATTAGLLDELPDVDNRSCQLLGPTALIVQGLMGVLVILSLIYKRHRETPKRPWRIWLFDVSKQVVGQMFVHGVNVFVSDLGSNTTENNACVFYFLNILIDTTLGVALIYAMLHLLTYIAKEKFGLRGFESGVYGSPPSIKYWARQAAIYVLALTTMKLMVFGLLALWPGIFIIGEWILSWTYTKDGDTVQVVFTMGIFPIIMNIVQFWLIDSIVKASNAIALDTNSSSNLDDAEHREPLFNAPSDDEDEDTYKPGDVESQRRNRHSSFSVDVQRDKSLSSDVDEYKSTPSTSTSAPHDEHSYPPSLSSSLTSAGSSNNDQFKTIRPAKNLMKKQRRGPPPPLFIQPVGRPAINSPQVSAPPSAAPGPQTPEQQAVKTLPPTIVQQRSAQNNALEWADSWDDADDWATRVGEEEWTGRRLEDKKQIVNGVWGTKNMTPSIAT